MQRGLEAKTEPTKRARTGLFALTARLVLTCTLSAIALGSPTQAEAVKCAQSDLHVTAPDARTHSLVCEAAARASALVSKCDLPPLEKTLDAAVVETLHEGCVGLYHCGEGLIEAVRPSTLAKVRNPDGAFTFLPLEAHFRSIVVHEMGHALMESAPCPFKTCVVSQEYFAYAFQVLSLTPEEQSTFVARSKLTEPVSRDELSLIFLMMAPNRFAQKVWAHANRDGDICASLKSVVDGTLQLDRERF